jgi:hypothetical protein
MQPEFGNEFVTASEASILNCSLRIEELIFRLPVEIAGDDWCLFYNARTQKACLVPQAIVWHPLGRALQFNPPTGRLTFTMNLQPTPLLSLTPEQIDDVKQQIENKFQFSAIHDAKIHVGIPELAIPEIGWEQIENDQQGTIHIATSHLNMTNQWAVRLRVHSKFAMDFKLLYLGEGGLPLRLNLEQYFLGKRSENNGASIESKIVAKDFEIVSQQDDFFQVLVVVDRSVFSHADKELLTLKVRYPQQTREFTLEVKKDEGIANLKLPRTSQDGETIMDLEYWSSTENRWLISEGAVDGLLIIDK